MALPIIDLSGNKAEVGRQICLACEDWGFFYVVGHGISEVLQNQLVQVARHFFSLPEAEKKKIDMAHGGRAWRGYFPLRGELTSGIPDDKEGIYFGEELSETDERVQRGLPLHGRNLFIDETMKRVVLAYLKQMSALGHQLMGAISLGLGLNEDYFFNHYTHDPFLLFRIFHYPPQGDSRGWGVGEHTDYGVLTILKQDDLGGLEVKSPGGWVAAPPVQGSFVCNIGDMLERMTKGRFRSTAHRVKNTHNQGRLSFPFFFDPGFDCSVEPLPIPYEVPKENGTRWDHKNVHLYEGTYGDYLIEKVSQVFPQLFEHTMPKK